MTTTLDCGAFPHILQRVLELSDTASLRKFRTVSASLREYADEQLFRHVALRRVLGSRDRAELVTPDGNERVMLLPDMREGSLWTQYGRSLKYIEILDVVSEINPIVGPLEMVLSAVAVRTLTDSGDWADATSTSGATNGTVTERRRICVRAIYHDRPLPSCSGLDVHLCAIRLRDDENRMFSRLPPPPQCTRVSQVVENLSDCTYNLSTLDNVIYLQHAGEQRIRDQWLRGRLLQNMDRPRFSLTIVLEQPDPDSRFLRSLCGVEYDPEMMEQVDMFNNLANLHIVGFEEYAIANPDMVVREMGLDNMDVSAKDVARMAGDSDKLSDLWKRAWEMWQEVAATEAAVRHKLW